MGLDDIKKDPSNEKIVDLKGTALSLKHLNEEFAKLKKDAEALFSQSATPNKKKLEELKKEIQALKNKKRV